MRTRRGDFPFLISSFHFSLAFTLSSPHFPLPAIPFFTRVTAHSGMRITPSNLAHAFQVEVPKREPFALNHPFDGDLRVCDASRSGQ